MSSQDSNENREDRMPRPLRVYCSISPFKKQNPSFVKLISDTSVQLELQDDKISGKQYTFEKIFIENTSKEMFDEVALPLVQGLIDGKSGVLFTCGVSMKDSEFGLKPSCLDVLFNSIASCQAGKFIFKPAGFNEFKMQSEDEAAYDRDVDRLRKNMASQPIKMLKTKMYNYWMMAMICVMFVLNKNENFASADDCESRYCRNWCKDQHSDRLKNATRRLYISGKCVDFPNNILCVCLECSNIYHCKIVK